VDAESFCPLPARNLADGVVDLARLLVSESLVLRMALQAKACGVTLLFAMGSPLEIVRAVIELIAIEMVDRVTSRWAGTNKSQGYQAVDRDPCGRPSAASWRYLEISTLDSGVQKPFWILTNLVTSFRMNAGAFALPINTGRDTSHIPFVRNFVQAFPARRWYPCLFLHNARVLDLTRWCNAI